MEEKYKYCCAVCGINLDTSKLEIEAFSRNRVLDAYTRNKIRLLVGMMHYGVTAQCPPPLAQPVPPSRPPRESDLTVSLETVSKKRIKMLRRKVDHIIKRLNRASSVSSSSSSSSVKKPSEWKTVTILTTDSCINTNVSNRRRIEQC
jgi:hypothetical protein